MFKIPSTEAVDMITLAELVTDGFAGTVGELVDRFAEEGVAVGIDHVGRLAVATSVAERMRDERAEAERIAAEEAARLAAEAREAREQQQAAAKAERDARAQRKARVQSLERASGVSIIQLEIELRNSITGAANTGMSYADRQRAENRAFTLDEMERFVLSRYGVNSLEEVTQ